MLTHELPAEVCALGVLLVLHLFIVLLNLTKLSLKKKFYLNKTLFVSQPIWLHLVTNCFK